ncbi:MAG: HU family DNA-binding protein [Prevotellaceae bacterium]|jgi:nucleoid DNA-binding protein|nr:HU family DNA-binding protein [Prevotellaceae bacterium]
MNDKLNIQKFVDALVQKHDMDKQQAENFIKAFFELIDKGLNNDKYVKVKGLGTFKVIDVESRESINVNTKERFEIQGHAKISFTPDNSLKDLINKPFAQFETVPLHEETILDDTPVERIVPEGTPPTVQEEETTDEEEETIVEEEETIVEEEEEEEETTTQEEPPVVPEAPPVVPEDPPVVQNEKLPLTPEEKEQRTTLKYFVGIVVFVVLLCGIGIAFMYNPDLYDYILPTRPAKQKTADSSEQSPVADSTTVVTDSLSLTVGNIPVTLDTTPLIAGNISVTPDSIPVTTAEVTPPPATPVPKPATVVEATTVKVDSAGLVASKKPLRAPAELTDAMINAPYRVDSTGYTIIGTRTTHQVSTGETLTRIALKYYGTKAPWPYIVKYNPKAIKNANNVPLGTVIKIPELVKK